MTMKNTQEMKDVIVYAEKIITEESARKVRLSNNDDLTDREKMILFYSSDGMIMACEKIIEFIKKQSYSNEN